jgi:immunoglobulin-binding protein 1
MNEPPQNLQALFVIAKNQKKSVESATETNNESYHELVATAIKRFEECQRFIAQLSLFSDNESVDDISTGDLQ